MVLPVPLKGASDGLRIDNDRFLVKGIVCGFDENAELSYRYLAMSTELQVNVCGG